jgi:hypothetical protein
MRPPLGVVSGGRPEEADQALRLHPKCYGMSAPFANGAERPA